MPNHITFIPPKEGERFWFEEKKRFFVFVRLMGSDRPHQKLLFRDADSDPVYFCFPDIYIISPAYFLVQYGAGRAVRAPLPNMRLRMSENSVRFIKNRFCV